MFIDITQSPPLLTNGELNIDLTPHLVDGFRVMSPSLARALGFRESFALIRSIPDEEKGCTLARTPGGEQRVDYLPETERQARSRTAFEFSECAVSHSCGVETSPQRRRYPRARVGATIEIGT